MHSDPINLIAMNRRYILSDKKIPHNGITCCILLLLMLCSHLTFGQQTQLVQVKAFDEQLVPYKNIEISINSKEYLSVGARGVAIIKLEESDLPIRTIKINDDRLEAASWNFGKGILEVIIRNKTHQLASVQLQGPGSLSNLRVTFRGTKAANVVSDESGRVQVPLAFDEKITSHEQFTVSGHRVARFESTEDMITLFIEPIRPAIASSGNEISPIKSQEYFKDFDLSKLDSIQSLTVFYAIFKNYQIGDMSDETKSQIDRKFNQLISAMKDSDTGNSLSFMGRITDTSYVADDMKSLLQMAEQESLTLDKQRSDFDEKIRLIQEKLEKGFANMDPAMRAALLSDLNRLEMLLIENESRFYKNQNEYRAIINSLKEKYFDVTDLENRLSESEAKRLEEQRQFRQKLFITLSVLFVFAVLIILLIYFSDKLKKQKKELVKVNNEINRINGNLEGLVAERTKLLEDTNRELDTFLYRASHDLRSPVRSIIGLCNIAFQMSEGESRELVQRVVLTTTSMDKLLKKLSMISEINHPTNFSSITLVDLMDEVKTDFKETIQKDNIALDIDCPADLVMYSYPNLLETIISNLLENAFFYSVLKEGNDAYVQMKASIVNDQVEIIVRDNGIGVDETVKGRLFDMFYKGNEYSKGNGLGLYIVQKSVQTLEGTVEVSSESGTYTEFIVRLPLKSIAFEANQPAPGKGALKQTWLN